MPLKLHEYANRDDLAEALAGGVAAVLAGGVASEGRASIAVSGGSTPALFFRHLSREPIEWSAVTVFLVDERYVPDDTDRSNAKLVRENLLKDRAADATLVPFWRPNVSPGTACEEVARAFEQFEHGLDVCVLGMGTDGHTASFFPDGDTYDRATDPSCPARALPVVAESQPETRVTLTLPPIRDARLLALHIEGEEKRRVLDEARAGADLPITRVLSTGAEVQTFWTP